MLWGVDQKSCCWCQGDHRDSVLRIAQLSRKEIALARCHRCPLPFCLFSYCLCTPYTKPSGTDEGWCSPRFGFFGKSNTRLTIPFALAVSAYLGCPWTPKEGYSSPSLRLIQEQSCVEELGLLRRPASDFHF